MDPSCGAFYASILSSSAATTCIKELDELGDFPGYKYLWFLYVPVYFIVRPVVVLYESLFRVVNTERITTNASHVPTFYAPQPYSNDNPWIAIVLAIVAAIFGGLHLIAWGFQFPSHIEQSLWRIGSLTITAFPTGCLAFILFAVFVFLGQLFFENKLGVGIPATGVMDNVKIILGLMAAFVGGMGLAAYMFARLLLVTQAVVLLRKQPDSAFYAIDWSRFFLHF